MPNVLVIAVDADEGGAARHAAATRPRARADAKDEAFFAACGLTADAEFYERFLRLGAVITWCEGAGAGRVALLSNTRRADLAPRPGRARLRREPAGVRLRPVQVRLV